MDKISELMDGELPSRELKTQIARLKSDPRLTESWDTYHLIRDTLRREGDLGPGFARRMRACLETEPVMIAPHTRLSYRLVRYTLPMAAVVAGVAVVAWLAFSTDAPLDTSQTMAQRAPETVMVRVATPEQQAPLPASAGGGTTDYLVAHQEFSPRTAMQGVAS